MFAGTTPGFGGDDAEVEVRDAVIAAIETEGLAGEPNSNGATPAGRRRRPERMRTSVCGRNITMYDHHATVGMIPYPSFSAMAYFIASGILSLAGIVGTAWLVHTDGYGRIPTDPSRALPASVTPPPRRRSEPAAAPATSTSTVPATSRSPWCSPAADCMDGAPRTHTPPGHNGRPRPDTPPRDAEPRARRDRPPLCTGTRGRRPDRMSRSPGAFSRPARVVHGRPARFTGRSG